MNNIRTALKTELKKRYDKVYERKAPVRKYPYITYEFYLTDDGTGRQLIFLDLDGWDNKDNTDELEAMMASVDLNKCVIDESNVTIVLERASREPEEEDDSRIKRRRYSYEGIVYERSE